ncbi:MAG TPA: hypothetical protein VNV41_02790, partial [Candidatus Acidoferrales bacterium]|nr:hypothetical protein [Candidatus Acidoferrales bacterium]
PLAALTLIAMGFRNLSVIPSAIGPVKATVLELDIAKAEGLVNTLIAHNNSAGSIREKILAFAAGEGIPI